MKWNLKRLLVEELQDLYSAEKQIVKALSKLVKGAKSPHLKAALTEHPEVTKQQVGRLEEAFTTIGKKRRQSTARGWRDC